MIIVEGADSSGKTILAKMIASMFGYTYIHSPAQIKHEETLKERLYWLKSLADIKEIILDRHYLISDIIYGNTIRDGSRISEIQLVEFLTFFNTKKHYIIFCDQVFTSKYKAADSLHLNIAEKIKLERAVKDHSKEIQDYYKRLMIGTVFPYVKYAFTIEDIKDYGFLFDSLRRDYHEC